MKILSKDFVRCPINKFVFEPNEKRDDAEEKVFINCSRGACVFYQSNGLGVDDFCLCPKEINQNEYERLIADFFEFPEKINFIDFLKQSGYTI